MANTNAPFGFKWLGFNPGGAVANFSTRTHKIAYNYGTALYRGDVLSHLNSGYIGRYTSGDAGSNVAGVAWGFEYLSTALGRRVWSTYLPTTDHAYDITAHVIPISGVPPQLFLVQAYATNFTLADVGQNIEPGMSASGTVVGGYGKSGMTIVQGTNEGTTNTYPFRIVDLYSSFAPKDANGIDDTSSYNIVVVASNPYEALGV